MGPGGELRAPGLSSLFASHPIFPLACLGQNITAGDIYRVLGWLWQRGGGLRQGKPRVFVEPVCVCVCVCVCTHGPVSETVVTACDCMNMRGVRI